MKRKLFFIFMTIMSALTIHAQQAPVVCFIGNVIGTSPCKIEFIDSSLYVPTSWSWTFPGGTMADGTATVSQNPIVIYSTPGIFNVTLTATNGYGFDTLTKVGVVNASICYYDTTTNHGCSSSGFMDLKNTNSIADIFPNPFDNIITVNFNSKLTRAYSFEIIDIYGRQLKNISLSNNNSIFTGDMPVGLYFYRLTYNNDILQTGQILKK